MSTQALEVVQPAWHSADMVLKRVRAVQQLMDAVMKKDTHYGVIPGTKKPTLYKAGSEQILSMFRIAIDPVIEDLSTDDECRIRVLCRLVDVSTGTFLGAGVGEASSSEAKYKWRRVVSKAEWAHFQKTSPERTRIKFGTRWQNNKPVDFEEEQVRADVPDVRNTILKMAKKRAQIDATLTVTGCSDMFEQDLEDLPPEIQEQVAERQDKPAPAPVQRTTAKAPNNQPAPVQTPPQTPSTPHEPMQAAGDEAITDRQFRMLMAIQKSAGVTDEKLKAELAKHNVTHRKDIPKSMFQDVINWLDPDFRFHARPNQDAEDDF